MTDLALWTSGRQDIGIMSLPQYPEVPVGMAAVVVNTLSGHGKSGLGGRRHL